MYENYIRDYMKRIGMNKKLRVLFIRPSKSSFIQNDLELLQKHFDVRVINFTSNVKKKPMEALKVLFFMIEGVLWADITLSWFADIHALIMVLLAKIFKRKSIVVVGGYEVAKVPEIGYGALVNPKLARRIRWVLEHADKILAVSEFSRKEILDFIDRRDVHLVYNAVDCSKFRPEKRKENLVITIASLIHQKTIGLKGLDTFVKAAKHLPEVRFVLIGGYEDGTIDKLKAIAPQNVEFVSFLSHPELIEWYQRASVYCQLSRYESFGVSLAEAMSCGCVPVITRNGALPEVVGSTGFYVNYGDENETADAIRKALHSGKGKEARERIVKLFSIERREKELKKVIEDLKQM